MRILALILFLLAGILGLSAVAHYCGWWATHLSRNEVNGLWVGAVLAFVLALMGESINRSNVSP